MFGSLFLTTPGPGPKLSEIALHLLVTGLAAQALGWVYAWSHGVLSYKPEFLRALVLLSLVVCFIVSFIGQAPVAMTFGALAALTVVRFRSAVREPWDALFLFGAVALGMTGGLGMVKMTAVATVVLGVTSLYLHRTAYGTRSGDEGSLAFRFEGTTPDQDEAVKAVLTRNCRRWLLVKSTPVGKGKAPPAGEDRIYTVTLSDPQRADTLIRELVASAPVTDARILVRAFSGEA